VTESYGTGRVVEPAGALPQPAAVLDSSDPMKSDEFEVAVERLCLDATSFASIRRECDADPVAMGERVLEIVAKRGKMHNPVTDSGGVALGTVTDVGPDYADPPAVGDRIVTLASLTLTPLRLDEIVEVDPDSAQIAVRGTAYVFNSAPWGPLPADLPVGTALEVYDVYGAGSHVARLASPGDTVCVMGAGHAGKLAMAAAREVTEGGTVIAIDADPDAIDLVEEAGLCDIGLTTDLRDPVGTRDRLAAAGAPEADLTVVVVSSTGCEPAAILATATGGTVLFFSMATSFQTAALTADGIGRDVRMLVGSGFTPDCGSWSLDLLRRSEPLKRAFGLVEATG
jgi:L-erythro-3,5-diaminohexanoate dehydrogenase